MPIMTSGDSRLYIADLKMPDGDTFIIHPTDDTVQVALVSKDLATRYTEPLTLSSTTPGADWSQSKLAFKFPKEATASIVFPSRGEIDAVLEVQVTFDALGLADDWTWRIDGITLMKGNIA